MTVAELRAANQVLADLLVEACKGRPALAAALVSGIAGIAAEQTLQAERARVLEHIRLGEMAGMHLAAEGIRAGATVMSMMEQYLRAARARRETPLRLISKEKAEPL